MTLAGQRLGGRYALLEVIGQGGMAVVYRARDERLRREVAVKVLRSRYTEDPAFVERFRREARHVASLHHENIVTIHDTGVDPDTAVEYMVMQLVDGPDLQEVLRRQGGLPVATVARIGRSVADALDYAHRLGIVHRDIKPANILIDADGRPLVADFGIARAATDAGATTSGLLLGSAQYASPEQVMGEPVTPASDLYSLGVVLYEAASGIRPFDGPSPAAVALERLRVAPRPLGEVAPHVSPRLESIVMGLLSRDPSDRPTSAVAVAIELERFRVAELGGVRRAGSRARAFTRRDRTDRRRMPAMVPAAAAVGGGTAAWTIADPRPGPRAADHTVVSRTGRLARERRRPAAAPILVPAFLGLGALSLAVLLGLGALFGGLGGAGQVMDRTGAPDASQPGVALLSPSPTASRSPTASPAPSPSPSPAPTPPPTPSPTHQATPEPTPERTSEPTDPPAPPPVVSERDPAETVARFYDLVEDHEYDAAALLWTARMRREYPPDGYIDGRFDPTTRIDIDELSIASMDLDEGVAVVDVAITEYRSSGPSPRRFVGSWDLVLTDRGWLMDEPHF